MRARAITRVRQHAPRGQALIEFALVLPTFVLVGLLFVQLCVLGVRWFQLIGVTSTVVRYAAASNGETPAVDAVIARIAVANGFQPALLLVEIDTDAGTGSPSHGQPHRVDQAQAADAPAPAGYGGAVTVHLTYQAPLLFHLFGAAVPVGTSLSQASIGAYGGLAP